MVQSTGASQLGMDYTVAVLKKAKNMQQAQGEAAIELIDAARVDASPSKGQRIDTVA